MFGYTRPRKGASASSTPIGHVKTVLCTVVQGRLLIGLAVDNYLHSSQLNNSP